jgi:feruloyl esterase
MSKRISCAFHAGLVLAGMVAAGSALATGNVGSFTRAGDGAVDYRKARVHGSAKNCVLPVVASLPDSQVLGAEWVPESGNDSAYCKVTGRVEPAVRWVAYLPADWNGRLYMHGNGGNAGEALDFPGYHQLRLNAVRNGFAAAFTNTGHDAATEPGAEWAHNDPVREGDYGHRAVHVTAVAVKGLLEVFYLQPATHAYFDGCSTGGRQGLMEAQRYPDDFDGILAGAPVFTLPDMLWQYRKNALAVEKTPISAEQLARLGEFIRSHYDADDGVADGVIGDPLAVGFLPSRDLPRAPQDPRGFTDAELATLDAIYAPVLANGVEIYPKTVVGAELPGQVYPDWDRTEVKTVSAWSGRVVPNAEGFMEQPVIVDSWFQYLAFDEDDPKRDWRAMDPARDSASMERMRGLLQAKDPQLSPFATRGGKLIIYHGWADFGVDPLTTIEYVTAVSKIASPPSDEFLRLYLVPGMFHCSGGTNVDSFDLITPLIDWVETGRAPEYVPGGLTADRIENNTITRTRPLCAYPAVARYNGSGDPDAADSFSCP